MQVDCVDEAPGTPRAHVGRLRLASPRISVRGLIQARVELEVERLGDVAAGLTNEWVVCPDRVEVMLNGERGIFGPLRGALPPEARFDSAASVTVALDGFVRGSFFLFVDDRQMLSLDEMVSLRATSEVVFLKLIPLKSG